MPKYKSYLRFTQPSLLTSPAHFCDYCDVYLTHDSMSVRKAHNAGRNHLRNVVEYYQQIGHEKAQSVIDSITSSYAAEGQANPMFQQHGGPGGFPPPPLPGFPGGRGMPPPPFGMPGGPGAPPPGFIPPPGGRGMPPFPPIPPNANGSGGPPPPNMPGGIPFPPPGGFPPNFQFPPPQGGPNGQPPPGIQVPGPVPSPGIAGPPPPGFGPPPGTGVGGNER